jgi:hypothetical protein
LIEGTGTANSLNSTGVPICASSRPIDWRNLIFSTVAQVVAFWIGFGVGVRLMALGRFVLG